MPSSIPPSSICSLGFLILFLIFFIHCFRVVCTRLDVKSTRWIINFIEATSKFYSIFLVLLLFYVRIFYLLFSHLHDLFFYMLSFHLSINFQLNSKKKNLILLETEADFSLAQKNIQYVGQQVIFPVFIPENVTKKKYVTVYLSLF